MVMEIIKAENKIKIQARQKVFAFARRLKLIIIDTGMYETTFARSASITPQCLSQILLCRSMPSFQTIQQILIAFDGINPDYLLQGKGKRWNKAFEQAKRK